MDYNVRVEGYGDISIEKGATLLDLSKKVYKNDYKNYTGARINNEIYHLNKKVQDKMDILFLAKDRDGNGIYRQTVSAIFIMAAKKLYDNIDVRIEHSLNSGLYAELEAGNNMSFSMIKEIDSKMREIIESDYPIKRHNFSREEAIKKFEKYGYNDKVRLYKTLDQEEVSIYRIDDHIDSFHGYLAPSTGFIDEFSLKYYYPGVIMLIPNRRNNYEIEDFQEQKKLATIFKEASRWLDILDLRDVGSLNEKTNQEKVEEVVRVSEALQEKKIADIADRISSLSDINIILVAGPTSSGKTTFSNRLITHLRVNGKKPVAISIDDYFLDRDKTPLTEDGTPDFETIDAVDMEALNMDLINLLEGKEIELSKFNFLLGKREKTGEIIKVDENHPIIIEGIHGLNPKLTEMIPEKNKFKIYISALTQLNIDSHNRISTTDTRLIRRIVRDHNFRGNSIERTLELWQGVRRGEEKYIFPFQEEADVMFDSALVYELAVLKKYVKPLLEKIDNSSVFYSDTKKLLRFLDYFKDIDIEEAIPPNSLLREFIGGTYINVH